ncbi:MAG: hypothetical protein JNL90_03440 [Planctomycetes bacterium]|nr:hypothetical protein [Planctomycetota bacterium]
MSRIAAVLALAGTAVVGGGSLLFCGVQALTPWYTPKAADMFSLAEFVTLQPSSSVVLTTVPAGSYLVLTDAAWNDPGDSACLQVDLIERDATGAEKLKVSGRYFGARSVLQELSHSDGHGVVFGPGTDVVLKNPSSTRFDLHCMLTGYFTER